MVRDAVSLTAHSLCLLLCIRHCATDADGGIPAVYPEEYVNIIAGSSGQKEGQHHSTGNTLPLTARPWGFNHWAPMTTDERTSWWSNMQADTFRGIRCTHQPSPWIGDYGWFVMSPYLGGSGDDWLGFTSYQQSDAVRPYKIDLTLGPYGTRVEFAPTNHSAIMRVTFPASVPIDKRAVCVQIPKGPEKDGDEKHAKAHGVATGSCKAANDGINLITRRFSDGVPLDINFAMYARLESDGLQIVEKYYVPSCLEINTQYVPLNMAGQERTQEHSVDLCQLRCYLVTGCAHFTFWNDGGCHLQDSTAQRVKTDGIYAAPPECPPSNQIRECCFKLAPGQTQAEVRVATSLISEEQSARALKEELYNQTLDTVVQAAKLAWRRVLQRVDVLDAGPPVAETFKRLEIFYSCLYRALLFPRRLDERTPYGIQHWSPYDGQVHDGIGVTDNGFWDTFRTVYPFLALAYPTELGELIAGWLNAYRAGGWLPKWASPGYRDSMVGTFADVVLSDAIIKNISGFDRAVAWEALSKDAYEINPTPKDTSKGKFGLKFYMDMGYIPIDKGIGEACSRTLDFAFADAATASAALKLGHRGDSDALSFRSKRGLKALFHNGLMGHRLANGDFKEEPAETWGDCFTEGSAWHHSFPPFDIKTLTRLYGGKEELLKRLRELFSMPSTFKVGSYRVEIHEMREMQMLGMGQYAHNNQPTHHMSYLFSMLGDQRTTSEIVRHILSSSYSTSGFAGDEDNGEMGAWYLLSAMGLYSVAVGVSEDYVLGAVPLFPRIWLRDLDITIEAPSATEKMPTAREVRWRSRPLPAFSISYNDLRHGGILRFLTASDKALGNVVSRMRGTLHQASKGLGRTVHGARGMISDTDSNDENTKVNWALLALALIGASGLIFVFRKLCHRSPDHDD
jgi:putative alpha-1,2-mannosidase